MPAVKPSPPAFKIGTHPPDQVGINDAAENAINNVFLTGNGGANLYIRSTSTSQSPLTVYKTITQSQRGWNGGDSTRNSWTIYAATDIDNNDPTWDPNNLINRGLMLNTRYGHNGPSYGGGVGIYMHYTIENSAAASSEFSGITGYLGGTATAGNFRNWGFFDWGTYGPVNVRPEIFGGSSMVVRNHYNGSPVNGPSVGFSVFNSQTGPGAPPAVWTSYPVDIGYYAGGISSGGNGDAFGSAFQAGGQTCYWTGDATMAGDMGQNGVGFRNKARNDGTTPTSRLGAFVSEGLGEAGALVFGTNTNDVNRVSLYRPSNGNLTLNGNLSITGSIAAGSGLGGGTARTPIWTATSPGTALTSSAALTAITAGASSVGTLTIPANRLLVGSMIVPCLFGTFTYASGTPTLYVEIALNGVIISRCTTAAFSTVQTGALWAIEPVQGPGFMVQSIGTGGTIIGAGRMAFSGGPTTAMNTSGVANAAPATVGINTTVAQAITVKMQWSGAAATYSIQLLGGGIYLDG